MPLISIMKEEKMEISIHRVSLEELRMWAKRIDVAVEQLDDKLSIVKFKVCNVVITLFS